MHKSQVSNVFPSRGRGVGGSESHPHTFTRVYSRMDSPFTLKHHLHGHTQVHTHPNTQAHTLKYMNTPTHICKQTGHTYAHMHTLTGLGRYSHMLVLIHMCAHKLTPHTWKTAC